MLIDDARRRETQRMTNHRSLLSASIVGKFKAKSARREAMWEMGEMQTGPSGKAPLPVSESDVKAAWHITHILDVFDNLVQHM